MVVSAIQAATPLELGNRRELFVDDYLIDDLKQVERVLHEPRDEGPVFYFDLPWEGAFSGYVSVIHHDGLYRAYYRGKPEAKPDGVGEVTCVAESKDGIQWTKPKLNLFEANGSKENNIIANDDVIAHNFCPFLDQNPAAPASARYKAIGSKHPDDGLSLYVSPDGIHWSQQGKEPVLTKQRVLEAFPWTSYMFDSQNVAFWSASEKMYVMYFRIFKQFEKDNVRRIARATSRDFIHWENFELMEYRGQDGQAIPATEQLYTNQTHPYFRAPHLYIATPARILFNRQAITSDQATQIGVHPNYAKDTSDTVFMTTRGGGVYDRLFRQSFIRPGIGPKNWISRTNYTALNMVQTGPEEMSIYTNQDYAQPTAHLRRYSLRLDGFASLRAPYEGGEVLTKPFIFSGHKLSLNFATSAAGGVKVEIQDADGKPAPGYSLADAKELIGNEIDRACEWKSGNDVSALAGKSVKLRIVFQDADIYALQFQK